MFCNQHNSLFKMKYTFVKSQSSLREMRVGIPGLSFVFCKLVAVTLEKKNHFCCTARLSTHEPCCSHFPGVCPVSYEARLCFENCIDKIGNYRKISVVPPVPLLPHSTVASSACSLLYTQACYPALCKDDVIKLVN